MGVAGRVLEPLARMLGVRPEALAPNNLWALTGRRLVGAAIAREHPDLVLATAPPPSALLATAAAIGSLPYVAELRDLWAGNPFFDRGGRLLPALERRPLANAAAVVTVTAGCRQALLALHPELESRLHVLPNGFDPALLDLRMPTSAREGRPATLIHAGALYGDRTAEALLAALGRPELQGRVRLELLGVVDARTSRALSSVQNEVTVQAPVTWRDAIDRVIAADIAVVINAPNTGGDMAVPSKLYEALALGRPVLALTRRESDSDRLLTELGQSTGIAEPDDPAAIAAAIERLLQEPPAPPSPEAIARFDRDEIAARYAGLLDELATRSSSATSSGTTTSRR